MKNITLKSLILDIYFITFLCLIFVVLGIINIFIEFIPKGWSFAILGITAWMIFNIPIIIRYKHVKKLCLNSEMLIAVIINTNSDILIHNGYYYLLQIKGTNTTLETSTSFRLRKKYIIGDEVKICLDTKNNEAVIVY